MRLAACAWSFAATTCGPLIRSAGRELSNGELLRAAEREGFEVFVTCDQNIERQNSLSGYRLAVVVLSTTHWPTIRSNPRPVSEAVERAAPGLYAVVTLPRPKLRRRAPPPRKRAD